MVVGEAEDGRQAIDLIESLLPEVVVLDIAMPNLNGIEAARQIVAKHPGIAVVILSMHSDETYVLRALKAGVRAYLLKDSAESDLIRAIRAVRGGKAFFSPAVGKTLLFDYVRQLQQRGEEDSYELLTPREREDPSMSRRRQGEQGRGEHLKPQPIHGGNPPRPHSQKLGSQTSSI